MRPVHFNSLRGPHVAQRLQAVSTFTSSAARRKKGTRLRWVGYYCPRPLTAQKQSSNFKTISTFVVDTKSESDAGRELWLTHETFIATPVHPYKYTHPHKNKHAHTNTNRFEGKSLHKTSNILQRFFKLLPSPSFILLYRWFSIYPTPAKPKRRVMYFTLMYL